MVPGAAQMSEFLGSVWAGVLIREGVLAGTRSLFHKLEQTSGLSSVLTQGISC